jgi:glutamine amidotransferase
MQILLDESEEFGKTKGLGIIPGSVVPISPTTKNGFSQKIPHIGWNSLVLPQGFENWDDSLLQEISPGESVYFVHSYMAVPNNPKHRIANCLYGKVSVPATIGRDNIYGCQFHPEKSGEVGLKILHRFLML